MTYYESWWRSSMWLLCDWNQKKTIFITNHVHDIEVRCQSQTWRTIKYFCTHWNTELSTHIILPFLSGGLNMKGSSAGAPMFTHTFKRLRAEQIILIEYVSKFTMVLIVFLHEKHCKRTIIIIRVTVRYARDVGCSSSITFQSYGLEWSR